MKLQLIFLTLFVVAALGYRDDNDNENRINRRGQGRGYRWRRRYDNQIAANAEDAELEDAISQEDESTTERYQRRKWRGRGENRRNQFKHNSDWHKRHEDELILIINGYLLKELIFLMTTLEQSSKLFLTPLAALLIRI
ncbi:CLUMA_CG016968, isoform A [Clunio marinus]|uniref:CLUMA_CG016968, isoform A n=1 Tax=Clunio marinus TaxID=568069 RepID=A0A1J1IU55_9DIPT|nr:CLUMA_CG016968, isoform A [Clunio marinus]